jgi:mannose-6-phosphate isomerase-like protein (cupin superfamily)
MEFETIRLPVARTSVAPDGSDVRVLLELARGGLAHFELAPGQISNPISHRTVDEIWFIVAGRGEMWRRQGARAETVALDAGVCVSIPVGTEFQFRAYGFLPLQAIGATMPRWPGDGEVIPGMGNPKWRSVAL